MIKGESWRKSVVCSSNSTSESAERGSAEGGGPFRRRAASIRAQISSLLRSTWTSAALALAGSTLAVLTSLLATSQTSIKSFIDDWFERCAIVTEVTETETPGEFKVSVFPLGSVQSEMDLTFHVRPETTYGIKSIEFLLEPSLNNAALHPLAGEKCPAAPGADDRLCADGGGGLAGEEAVQDATIRLSKFRSEFAYVFRVRTEPPSVASDESTADIGPTDLALYVKYADDAAGPFCRVERASLFNLYSRSGRGTRFGLLAAVLLMLAFGIGLLRSLRGKADVGHVGENM